MELLAITVLLPAVGIEIQMRSAAEEESWLGLWQVGGPMTGRWVGGCVSGLVCELLGGLLVGLLSR